MAKVRCLRRQLPGATAHHRMQAGKQAAGGRVLRVLLSSPLLVQYIVYYMFSHQQQTPVHFAHRTSQHNKGALKEFFLGSSSSYGEIGSRVLQPH